MNPMFVILLMFFFHVVDDYYLQGILANMKQKSWWEKNAPKQLYQHDYIMALAIHSFSWAFMIMLPIAIYQDYRISSGYVLLLVVNAAIHGIVDHLKANLLKINLITDQFIHLAQIVITFCLCIAFG